MAQLPLCAVCNDLLQRLDAQFCSKCGTNQHSGKEIQVPVPAKLCVTCGSEDRCVQSQDLAIIAQQEAASLATRNEALQQELRSLQATFEQSQISARAELQAATSELSQKDVALAQGRQQLVSGQEIIGRVTADRDTLQQQLASTRAELQEAIAGFSHRDTALAAERRRLEESIGRVTADRNMLQEQLKHGQKQMSDAQRRFATDRDALQKQLSRFEDQLNSTQRQLQDSQAVIARATTEHDKTLNALHKKLSDEQEQLSRAHCKRCGSEIQLLLS
eukprot:TRINITY_DN8743_c1_g1_i2.p1 TRINITY_DN8743_c1_g1~~TRINITY_DN8743_c1_g1_i2.p1  ORF type:complete len:313 (-),score=72.79 TRINITY_DN8743_c1_g1_i2:355-1182(-)